MFLIIQSNDTQKLAERLLLAYKTHSTDIFKEFVVIVPAKVLEEWLKKTIAKQLGVSSLFATQFWGQYQWQLIGRVLDCDASYLAEQNNPDLPKALKVPETALLSGSVIRWRLFSYLADNNLLTTIADDESHALHPLLSPLFDDKKNVAMMDLWRLCDGIARLYVGYLTERTDWLDKWTAGRAVNVESLIADKEKMSDWYGDEAYLQQHGLLPADEAHEQKTNTAPEWLVIYYQNLENALRFLWKGQFASVYRHRSRLEHRFWQVLEDQTHPVFLQKNTLLPKPLYLFTVQQLPQIELDFLKRLSLHTDVVLFHFNPSMAYWADIKDKSWLQTQKIMNWDKVQFFDYGHGLLSRLGKSARETFAMLSEMAGGDDKEAWQPIWRDIFDETLANTAPTTLLEYLKADILQLQESPFDDFQLLADDDSLVIHNCHSLKRQLEIARLLIGKWLNQTNKDGKTRHLSDIAIMLPDIQSHHELIRSVFVAGVGMDGLQLPAQITGVVDESTHKLWAAILGVYQLPAGRLYADELFDWLVNPYVYQAFGLSFEQALRATELLVQAGFVRGLDEIHLKQTLHEQDTDFRRTLAFAIDRLALSLTTTGAVSGVLYPFVWQSGQLVEKTQTLAGVTLDDGEIVQALCAIYLAIVSVRDDYEQKRSIEDWLQDIENKVINRYFYLFRDTQNLKSIFDTMNAMKASIRANNSYHYGKINDKDPIQLPLKFVLDALSDGILAQQIAAEPSGMITFGRFGSLRGISFGLVIMLGMNLSEFPRTEPINRLDLKKAGLPRRGDRISEDDDNGAFLEAILQARENCWIFYDGQSSDGKKQLPASPVGELLAFLKGLDWDFALIESQLIKTHTPTPFHQDNFDVGRTNIVSPILWQNVHNAMLGDRKTASKLIDLPNEQTIKETVVKLNSGLFLSGTLHLSVVANALKNPAKTYLSDKLYFANEAENILNEPLALNHLDNYKLNQVMLDIDGDKKRENELLYGTQLPAGVSRQTLLDEKKQAMGGIFALYHDKLSEYNISKTPIKLIDDIVELNGIDGELKLQIKFPKNSIIWHVAKIQSFGMDKLIECYLLHLCWQIQLNQTNIDNDDKGLKKYSSFWFFCKDIGKSTTVIFNPMSKKDASYELTIWLNFYHLIKIMPICLTPKNAMDYLANQQQNIQKTPEKLFEDWLKEPYQVKFVPDDNCHHRYWQTILGHTNPLVALMTVLPIADIVYRGLFFNSRIMNE